MGLEMGGLPGECVPRGSEGMGKEGKRGMGGGRIFVAACRTMLFLCLCVLEAMSKF